MDVTFWTGLLSFITQYIALVVATIFIVDFFSYKSKKAQLIATSYFILLSVIQFAIANFLLQEFTSGALRPSKFQHSYNNILLSLSIHVFFGLLVLSLHLKNVLLRTVSLVTKLWNHAQNRRKTASSN